MVNFYCTNFSSIGIGAASLRLLHWSTSLVEIWYISSYLCTEKAIVCWSYFCPQLLYICKFTPKTFEMQIRPLFQDLLNISEDSVDLGRAGLILTLSFLALCAVKPLLSVSPFLVKWLRSFPLTSDWVFRVWFWLRLCCVPDYKQFKLKIVQESKLLACSLNCPISLDKYASLRPNLIIVVVFKRFSDGLLIAP